MTQLLKKKFSQIALLIFFALSLGGCAQEKIETLPSRDPKNSIDLVDASNANEFVDSAESKLLKGRDVETETVRNLALTILNEASDRSSIPEATIYKTVSLALKYAAFKLPPPGKDLRQCLTEKNVLAFVMSSQLGTIHLCARALKGTSWKKLAQIFIHEATHVAGVRDECISTRIEVGAMRNSGRGLSFKNGYMQRCGVK